MQRLLTAVDGINEWTGRVVAFAAMLIVVFTMFDVGSRVLFSRPTDWSFEVTKQLYALHFMLLGGYALLHRTHVEVDVFKERFSRRGQAILDVIGYLLFFLPFMLVLLVYTGRFALRSIQSLETTYGVLSIPVYPIKAVMVIAAVLLTLQGLVTFLRALQDLGAREEVRHDLG